MNKSLLGLLLTVALALASGCANGGVRTSSVQAAPSLQVVEAIEPEQDPEPIKDLGGGYLQKRRQVPDVGETILVRFPKEKWMTEAEDSFLRFREGVLTAAVKTFTCAPFGKECLPRIDEGPAIRVGEKVFDLIPLYEDDTRSQISGIIFVPRSPVDNQL